MNWSRKLRQETGLRFQSHLSNPKRQEELGGLLKRLLNEREERNESAKRKRLESLAAPYKIDAKTLSYMVTVFVALIPFAGFVYARTYLGIFDIDATLFLTTEDYITFAIYMLYPFAYMLPFYFLSYAVIRKQILKELDLRNKKRSLEAESKKNSRLPFSYVYLSSSALIFVYAVLLTCYSIFFHSADLLPFLENISLIAIFAIALYYAKLKWGNIVLISYNKNKVICYIMLATFVVNIVVTICFIWLIISLTERPPGYLISSELKMIIQYALILTICPAVIHSSMPNGTDTQAEDAQARDTKADDGKVNSDVVRETILMVLVFVVSCILLHLTPYPVERDDQSTFYFKDHIVMENGENGKEKSCNGGNDEKCLTPLAASSNFHFFYCKNCESPHPKSYAVNRRSILFAEKEGDK